MHKENLMEYILMFQNIEVALMEIDPDPEISSYVVSLRAINERYLPFSIRQAPDVYKLAEASLWVKNRCIPKHRLGLKAISSELGGTPLRWMLKSHGASAQDGYWLKKPNDKITWPEISVFHRKFDYSVGNLIFDMTSPEYIFDSPDLTTGGIMPKTWRVKDDKLFLIKHGTAPDYQEPYNEKMASVILSKICPVPFVKYDLIAVQEYVCSICENFMNEDLALITASELMRTEPKPEYLTSMMHLKERCRTYKIPGYKDFLDYMTMADYIIGNTDRNFGNFGFLYDVEHLRFIGPAPIYDNGTAFWDADFDLSNEECMQKDQKYAKALIYDASHHFNPNLHQLSDLEELLYQGLGTIYTQDQLSQIYERMSNKIDFIEHYIERSRTKKRDRGIER